ncbi:suppressor of cytokine signaling 2 [Plakobranchus ocellatus]|uniref:Suppressor of cytokine signaling 2 n=1 Tax=Plakobranchus ocellatus TaxID=259542 RepID=A0AAV4DCE1_9GAST|nr:suppressor of cytokine signaling 2 [Plakobranchus ocellatus]
MKFLMTPQDFVACNCSLKSRFQGNHPKDLDKIFKFSTVARFHSGLATETQPFFDSERKVHGKNMCHKSRPIIHLLQSGGSQQKRNLPAVAAGPEEEGQDITHDDSGFGSGGSDLSICFYKPLSWCINDLQKLQVTHNELEQSCFFFGDTDSDTARRLLRRASVGTFLVRNSSDSRFLYSLSMMTERGATSVRIVYENGLFQFDCDQRIKDAMPRFESVLALLDFYVLLSQEGGNQVWRWEESSGNKHMKMTLLKPKRSSVPSLAHLTRVKVNQCLENVFFPHLSVDRLHISSKLKDFLKAYPYRS